MPYPTWPFGTVPPKELEKYARRLAKDNKQKEVAEHDAAPF